MSIFTFDGLVLNSMSINTLAYADNSVRIVLYSQFDARGPDPITSIQFVYGGQTVPSLGNASVIVDVVYYYAPNGTKNFEVGTYFKRLFIEPQNFAQDVLYRIELREELNSVFSFFSSKVSDLTIEDVGFLGRIHLEGEFANSTSVVGDKNYIRLTLTCDGNMTTVVPDFTIPDDADLLDATWGAEEMVRIIPTRVQTSFSVSPNQRISEVMYVSWKMPETPPEPYWYDKFPWKYVIPGLVGVALTILFRDIIPRTYRFLKARR